MKKKIVGFLLFLALVSISCRLLAFGVNPAEVESMVAATLTAQPMAAFPTQVVEPLPPTSEPTVVTAASLHPPELRVSFVGPDRNLYTWAKSSGLTTLQATGDVTDVKISQDGSLIAYTRMGANEQYSLWVTSFKDTNARQVMTSSDFVGLKTDQASMGTSPANLKWIPGTHRLTFTTREIFEGPGMALNDDLIVVDGDKGTWDILLKARQGGVAAFSPDGRWMALSTAKNISIMDVNGIPAPGPGLDFPPVATYSEYQYYPSSVWSPDSTRLAVFIPTDDPLKEPRGPSSVWSMDVQGGAPIHLAMVTPQFIGPVTISPDLQKLFYVREIGSPAENRREMVTMWINAKQENSVFTGGIPITHDWNPDSTYFAYQTDQSAAVTVSEMDGSVGNLSGTDGAYWFAWVDSNRYLFSRVVGDTVELYLGNQKEGNLLLAALPVTEYFRLLVDFVQ